MAPIFSDFNLKPFSAWSLWLIASFALMVMYDCFWIRYFRHPNEPRNLYGSFYGVPIAGATLPVAAFLLLGIYGKVIWMIGAAIILGIGLELLTLPAYQEGRQKESIFTIWEEKWNHKFLLLEHKLIIDSYLSVDL